MLNKKYDVPYHMGKYPDDSRPKLSKTNIEHLYGFITERYSIYKKREQNQPAPWTNNPILRDYKFTNVRREHDRTTLWYIDNIANNPDMPYIHKLLRGIAYRLYSKVETCELLRLHNPKPLTDSLIVKRLSKAPDDFVFYTNAFYTTGMRMGLLTNFPDTPKPLLPLELISTLESDFTKKQVHHLWKLAHEPVKYLDSVNGIGGFLSYQIFVDWTYIPEFPFSENEYVVAGPGAKKGLGHIFKDPKGLNHAQQLFWLRDNLERLFQKLDPSFSTASLFDNLPPHDRKFNVMSLQNCMCELSKYIRAVEGTGRPKNKYNGR